MIVKRLVAVSIALLFLGGTATAEYKAGLEYLKKGQTQKALAEFQADVEIYGSYWYYPAYMSAVCYMKMKDNSSAMQMLREAESATEKSRTKVLDIAKIKTLEAQILVNERKYNEAISLADKYIPQSPSDLQGSLLYIKGFAENKIGQSSKAVNDLLQSVALDPKSAKTYYELGYAYVKNNNLDGAIGALEKSLKLDPRNKIGLNLLTDVCLNRARTMPGDRKDSMYQKAADWSQTGLKHFSSDRGLMLNLGNAYLGLRQYVAAISIFEKMAGRYRNDKYVMFGLASSYVGNKDFEKALPILRQLKSKMPNEAVIYTYTATAQLALANQENTLTSKLTQAETAMDTLRSGRSKFPSNSGIRSKINEASTFIATLRKNIDIEKKNKDTDQANKRNMKTRILKLQERIRKAEELKRKQGLYPANYDRDKKDLADVTAQYKKLYGPLNF
ncbi:MAG: hypothetical protein CO090_09150 [Acidobacteria bacterium CG_4_9_14_3_um_filter_49_7]|nr:MAG: hypothetical protein CO090_09150 [Acidobacteria bacterium CG_4_9_14_3_um_filter_49_7]